MINYYRIKAAFGEAVISRISRNLSELAVRRAQKKISQNILRNNEESLERVPGVFSKMAASINDEVLLKYLVFERNKCYYCCYMLLMRV